MAYEIVHRDWSSDVCSSDLPLTADGDGRIHGRQLADRSAEPFQYCSHLLLSCCDRLFGEQLAGGIQRIGGISQLKGGCVAFILVGQQVAALGRPSDKDGQHAGRHRVECACVSHLAGTQHSAHLCHHIKGGKALRLVHNDDPVVFLHPFPSSLCVQLLLYAV